MSFQSPSVALEELLSVLTASKVLEPAIAAAGELLINSLRQGGRILTCGNGGSATAAQHLAEEFLGRYQALRRPLPAMCLNSDPATLTCIANDFGYEQVFSRQVEALATPTDVLVGLTTSGNSANVLAAFATARTRGAKTILLGGKSGGRARGQCDAEVIVPSLHTARIQEVHTLVLHCWLEQVDAAFPV
jgi:D-sedoheptulose 7-phosphate isomerase